MGKRVYAIAAIIVLLALMLTTTNSINAQLTQNNSQENSNNTPWLSPKNFSDPVGDKIMEYKAAKLSNDQITKLLEAQGMGWCPETGAHWLGIKPTPEQLAGMQQPTNPFAKKGTSLLRDDKVEASVDMGSSYAYMGGANNMSPGSIACAQNGGAGGTTDHYITMHFGKAYANDTPCWCEVGVANWSQPTSYQDYYYTYEGNDPVPGESGWVMINPVSSQSYQTPYSIYLTGANDQYGWQYRITINYTVVRTGHVQALYNSVNFADEIFSLTGDFTIDCTQPNGNEAHFVYSYLYDGTNWDNWNNYDTTNFEQGGSFNPFPLSTNHYTYDNCWVYNAWTSST